MYNIDNLAISVDKALKNHNHQELNKCKNIIKDNYLEMSISEFKRNFRKLLKVTKNIFFYKELLIEELSFAHKEI